MALAEVVDLTGLPSSPPVCLNGNDQPLDAGRATEQLKIPAIDKDRVVPLEDGELPRTAKPTMSTPQKQRKRKKSQQDPVAVKDEHTVNTEKRRRQGDERDNMSSRDRSRSPPNRATRKRGLREMPSDSLFFVDDKPADIRGPYTSPTLAGPSGTQNNDGLVLPPHVNVADGSSEPQEPPLPFSDAEEDEGDFIDYLDVDGDRSVCIFSAEPLSLCALIQKIKF